MSTVTLTEPYPSLACFAIAVVLVAAYAGYVAGLQRSAVQPTAPCVVERAEP